MRKNKIKRIVGLGVASVLALILSVLFSIIYNESRLVAPMDFSTYVFRPKDLPMLCAVPLFCLYVWYLLALLIGFIYRQNRAPTRSNYTRRLNPKLGLLGFLGFFGFTGFATYHMDKTVFPFIFFLFFGFFGFFFEGKMSGLYMDERYLGNVQKAQLQAYRVGFVLVFLLLLLLGLGAFKGNLEHALIFLVIGLSLSVALVLFLSEYLLYRLDQADPPSDDEV